MIKNQDAEDIRLEKDKNNPLDIEPKAKGRIKGIDYRKDYIGFTYGRRPSR